MRLVKVSAAVILVLLAVSASHALPRSASGQISSHDPVTVEERAAPQCDERQVFKTCQSSSCAEMSCDQLLGTLPKRTACTKDCATGCFCRKGFYRHRNLRCVTAAECRKS
uniref:Cysteine-rich antimicrobial peptide n=1 Tax=Rhipicephalus haemaphysaloides TaxID=237073 RepID=A0A0N7AP63_RHIHE|nr:cysteine-rich antimicrobial peptide [Rhipicephalus haemaphysaloides]